MAGAGLLKVLSKGGKDVSQAIDVLIKTEVDQAAPTVINPAEQSIKLDQPVVRNEAKKELKEIREQSFEIPEPELPKLSAGETPSQPMEPPKPEAPKPEMPLGQEAPEAALEAAPTVKPMPDADLIESAKDITSTTFDPAKQGGAAGSNTEQLNFENLTTMDDVKAMEQRIAEGLKVEVDEARRGTIANEQLSLLADDLGLQRSVVEQVLKREQGDVLNPEQMLAARKVLAGSAKRLKALADKVATGNATNIEKLEYQQQLMFHEDYYKGFMGARAEAGRLLNTFKIPVGSEENVVNRMMELSESSRGMKIEESAKLIRAAETLPEINKLVDNRGIIRKAVLDPAYEIFVNGILSGARTQEINIFSNGLFQLMNAAELGVAGQMAKFSNRADKVYLGEGSMQLAGSMQAFTDAIRFFSKAFKSGEAIDDVEKFENITRRKAISSESFEALQKDDPFTHALARVVDYFGAFIRLPTERGLTPTDEFFKTFATRGKHASLAYREVAAQKKAKGLSDEQAQQLYADLLRNPTKEIVEQSADYAYEATFQKALGQTGRNFQTLLAQTPGARWVAPFVKTLINVFNESMVSRSPLGLLTPQFRQDLMAGSARGDLARARLAMGTMTVLSVAMLTKGGHITGGEGQRGKGRGIAKTAGIQPYSFKFTVGDETYYQSFQRMEPVSMLIGATADIVEMLDYLDRTGDLDADVQEQFMDAVLAVAGGIAENTLNKSVLVGVSDFFQAAGDPTRYGEGYMKNYATSMIPYVSLRRDLTKLTDPNIRQAWELVDKIKATVPALSTDVASLRDEFGDKVEQRGGALFGPMSIFPDTTQTKDFVKLELHNLYKQTDRIPLSKPSKFVEGMKLKSKEYEELIFLSRKAVEVRGRTFREALEAEMDSRKYLLGTLSDRVDMVKSVQIDFDKKARKALEQDNPSFAARLDAYRERKLAIEEQQ